MSRRSIAAIVLSVSFVIFGSIPPAHASGEDPQAAAVAAYRDGRLEEAGAAFDTLIAKNPADDPLKIWRTMVSLEQARRMKESGDPGYKNRVVTTYGALKLLGRRNADNPEWCLAMAKAFWLNERSAKARKAIEKALFYRADYPDARILLGDIEFGEAPLPSHSILAPGVSHAGTGLAADSRQEKAAGAAAAYRAAIESGNPSLDVKAEALFKLGLVESLMRKNEDKARKHWENAASAAPESRFGKLAQEKLTQGKGAK